MGGGEVAIPNLEFSVSADPSKCRKVSESRNGAVVREMCVRAVGLSRAHSTK